jgi:glycine oxidase
MDVATRKNYDAIIVGGGVLGLAVAHELGLRGNAKFLHIYPEGHGADCASTAAGAMISAFGEVTEDGADVLSKKKLAFRVTSQQLYPDWLRSIESASGKSVYMRSGIVMIANAHGRADQANLARLKGALDEYGRAYHAMASDDIAGFSPRDAYVPDAAIFVRDDLSVDSFQLLQALAASVAETGHGTTLHGWASGVRHLPNGCWEVTTSAGDHFTTPELVLCNGAHLPELLGPDLLPMLLIPSLYFAKGIGVVVSGAPVVPHTIRTPNRADACGVHVVPRADGRLYIGASTHYGHATSAARGATPGEVTAILGDTLRQIDHRLRDATIDEVRYGLRPVSGSGGPLIGRTSLKGLSIGTGTFRTGFVMAPLIARLIVDGLLLQDSGFANPWPIEAGPTAISAESSNLALYHLNLGLRAYQDLRLRNHAHRRNDAQSHWEAYLEIAGANADNRIVALASTLRQERPGTEEAEQGYI